MFTMMASLCPLDEEPEEELTVEQLIERAEGGDARAQTRVSKTHSDRLALGIVVSRCRLTQSGWGHVSIFGWLEDDPILSIRYTKIFSPTQIILNAFATYCSTGNDSKIFYHVI